LKQRAAIFQGSVVPPPDVLKEALAPTEAGGMLNEAPLAPFAGHVMRASQPHLEALIAAHRKENKATAKEPLFAEGFFDFSLLMFVLSALPFELHEFVLREAALTVKPGTGRLLFRDYCIGDAAATRFEQKGGEKNSRKVDDNLFVRGDGTLAAFIDPRVLVVKAASAGLIVEELKVIRRSIENRGEGLSFERCWLHAVFRRSGSWVDRSVDAVVLAGKIEEEREKMKEEARKEADGENATTTKLILMAIGRMMA
jgi:hypothetical protein